MTAENRPVPLGVMDVGGRVRYTLACLGRMASVEPTEGGKVYGEAPADTVRPVGIVVRIDEDSPCSMVLVNWPDEELLTWCLPVNLEAVASGDRWAAVRELLTGPEALVTLSLEAADEATPCGEVAQMVENAYDFAAREGDGASRWWARAVADALEYVRAASVVTGGRGLDMARARVPADPESTDSVGWHFGLRLYVAIWTAPPESSEVKASRKATAAALAANECAGCGSSLTGDQDEVGGFCTAECRDDDQRAAESRGYGEEGVSFAGGGEARIDELTKELAGYQEREQAAILKITRQAAEIKRLQGDVASLLLR